MSENKIKLIQENEDILILKRLKNKAIQHSRGWHRINNSIKSKNQEIGRLLSDINKHKNR